MVDAAGRGYRMMDWGQKKAIGKDILIIPTFWVPVGFFGERVVGSWE
jgi:hypothetical protein